MQGSLISYKNKKGLIDSPTLILIAFFSAFFPRIIESIGFPSLINFTHFFTVPIAFVVIITTTRTKNRYQKKISQALLIGLGILLSVMTASALLNQAGIINIILHFLMLGEPFMMLVAIICIPMSLESLNKVKSWFTWCAFFNLGLALIQWPLSYSGRLYRGTYGEGDAVQGVFYLSGAGNYVSVSVSLCFAMYYFVANKTVPLWIRSTILFASFWQLLVSDSKQILLAFALAWAIFSLIQIHDLGKVLKYIITIVISLYLFVWCVENVPAFSAFSSWMNRLEVYGPEGEATLAKTGALRVLPTFFTSPLNWWLGLGPGHTASRLGGWMIKDYASLLNPLGATTHPASAAVWQVVYDSWIAKESTMFSPFFGWAGIWGDIGFLGLAAYLFLGFLVWQYICDDLSRFWILTICVIGLIFTQMEEPGYMLSMATLIGLRWQERQTKKQERKLKNYFLTSQSSANSWS
jgi:hypothetical protein